MTSDFLEPPPIPFNPFSKEGEIMVFLTSNLEDLLVFLGQPETTLTAAESSTYKESADGESDRDELEDDYID